MRQGPGDAVRVFNARDGEWAATIQTLRKDRGTIVFGTMERSPQATEGVELLFAPLKRDATELVIRMGTELGVTCFRPVITERTNTHRLNLERLALIASEAAEQCERLDIPEILPLESLKTVLSTWPEDKPLFAALERRPGEDGPMKAAALLIGPEGDFQMLKWLCCSVTPLCMPLHWGRWFYGLRRLSVPGWPVWHSDVAPEGDRTV